jgi:hypothetical protein
LFLFLPIVHFLIVLVILVRELLKAAISILSVSLPISFLNSLLLLGVLDLPLPLRLYRQHFSFGVLIKHFQHQVGKLDGVMQVRRVVLLGVEVDQRVLGDDAEVVVEDVRGQDLSVTLVLFI